MEIDGEYWTDDQDRPDGALAPVYEPLLEFAAQDLAALPRCRPVSASSLAMIRASRRILRNSMSDEQTKRGREARFSAPPGHVELRWPH